MMAVMENKWDDECKSTQKGIKCYIKVRYLLYTFLFSSDLYLPLRRYCLLSHSLNISCAQLDCENLWQGPRFTLCFSHHRVQCGCEANHSPAGWLTSQALVPGHPAPNASSALYSLGNHRELISALLVPLSCYVHGPKLVHTSFSYYEE